LYNPVLLHKFEILQVSVDPLNPAAVLLQISAKHIIVTLVGEIIDHELHSPFVYLLALQKGLKATDKSSRHVSLGALAPNFISSLTDDLSQFLSMLRFEHRERVAELSIKLETLSLSSNLRRCLQSEQ
jgi:hypothetical protein